MVYCTFSGIKEQTPADENSSSQPSSPQEMRNKTRRKDMRCFYKDSHLTVVTRGGLKYVNNLRLQIDAVFPMEDGLLIRAVFNSDFISFELGANPPIFQKTSQKQSSQRLGAKSSDQTYVHLSLLEHPLNEAYPVSLVPFTGVASSAAEQQQQQQHVNTELSIFYVSQSLPLCLIYDPERKATRISLICRYQKANQKFKQSHGDSFNSMNMSGNQFENRNQHNAGFSFNSSGQNTDALSLGLGQLPQVFGPSQVSIVTQFEASAPQINSIPDKVHLCRGLAHSDELTVTLFFAAQKQAHVYACRLSMQQQLGFSRVAIYKDVDQLETLDYSHNCSGSETGSNQNSIKLISDSIMSKYDLKNRNSSKRNETKNLAQIENQNFATCKGLQYCIKRLNQQRSECVMYSKKNGSINIIGGGYSTIATLEATKLLQSMSINGQLIGISDTIGSNIQLHLQDGSQRRVTLKHNITDFTVRSLIKILEKILPANIFQTLNKDVVTLFTQHNQTSSVNNKGYNPDQLEKFANFLVSLLCKKESTLLSKQKLKLAQAINLSSVLQTSASGSSWQSQSVKQITGQKKGSTVASSTPALSYSEVASGPRKRLSVAQTSSSVIGSTQPQTQMTSASKRVASGKSAKNSKPQQEKPLGIIPDAFDLMLQSDFNVDYMMKNMQMFDTETLQSALDQSSTKLNQSFNQKQSSPSKFVSPSKTTQISSPLKKLKSGQKSTSLNPSELLRPGKKEAPPSTKVNQPSGQSISFETKSEHLQPYKEKIFQVFHLFYEDLKVQRLRFLVEGRKLRRVLLAWLLEEPFQPQKTAYVAYYLNDADKDDPKVRTLFATELKRHAEHVQQSSDADFEQVPQLLKWIEQMLQNDLEINDFPVCFEQTRIICRLYQVLFHRETCYTLPLKDCENKSDSDSNSHSVVDQDSCLRQVLLNKNSALYQALNRSSETATPSTTRDYLMLKRQTNLSELHIFEKVLHIMKEEQIAMDQLQSCWPKLVALPFMEVLRYTRLHLQEIQTVPWPVSLYRLIHREDIINNLMQQEGGPAQQQLGSKAQKHFIANQGQKLMRNQSAEIKRAMFKKKRMSKEYALNRNDSNVFSSGEIGCTDQLIDEELQQTKMQNAIVQELIGGGDEEQQDKDPSGLSLSVNAAKSYQTVSNQMTEFLKNKFGKDTRYKEVEHMLSSEHVMNIKLEPIPGGADQNAQSDEERQRLVKAQLEKVFRRHVSKCVGRGALTLGIQETIPTETLEIPKINQQGQVVDITQNDLDEARVGWSTISMNLTREEKEKLQWPYFHNGVASSLRISQTCFKRSKPTGKQNILIQQHQPTSQHNMNQTRNWIMYHKPNEPKNEHGGFLLGIGLLGQLDSLQAPDLYQHLKQAHDSTTIGILLGRAASQIGKRDDQDTRMMCLHIPALLPQNLLVDISLPVQSAAIISAGMLYQGSQNRLISEMLIAQIAKKPTSDKMIEREGYALSAGIALGLVNLASSSFGKGQAQTESENLMSILGIQQPAKNTTQIQDLQLDERLIRFIEGGKSMALPRSMVSLAQQQEVNKSSAIRENEMVNVYVTGSAGVMALTLTHLKSNNSDIANRLVMPHTFYDMEFVMPKLLLQKVLCKNLIMWDNIQCTQTWLQNQIPPLVREIFESDFEVVSKKFAQRFKSEEIDLATVALCYVNIIAGATFSIGFKYAGTGSEDAKKLIIDQIEFFRKKLKVVPGTVPSGGPILTNVNAQTKNQVDKATVETCLCVLAFALGLVMAGTCDIEAFRLLRVLRKRLEQGEMKYGYNMAINMSIGFLFLGSGAYTFSRSERAIAALLISTYPIMPSSELDNRYHLQALRHFYVLAIETRLLQAKDIDTGKFVNVNVSVKVRDECTGKITTVKQQTPNIVNGQIIQIEVRDHPEYHDVCQQVTSFNESADGDERMDVDNDAAKISQQQSVKSDGKFEQSALQQVVYVKRKTYMETNEKDDAQAHQSTISISHLVQTGFQQGDLEARAKQALTRMLSVKDVSIEAFLRAFIVDSNEEAFLLPQVIKAQFDKCLDSQLALCSEISSSSNENQKMSYVQRKHIKQRVRSLIKQSESQPTLQRQLMTLIALEECYVQDKVTALPLYLQIFDTDNLNQSSMGVHELIPAYKIFMERAVTQFAFIKQSPQILPDKMHHSSRNKVEVDESFLNTLKEYVRSNATIFLTKIYGQSQNRHLPYIAKMLEPTILQLTKLTLSQAYDQLQTANIDQAQTMKILRQIASQCLRSRTANAGVGADNDPVNHQQVLDAIIQATLSNTDRL